MVRNLPLDVKIEDVTGPSALSSLDQPARQLTRARLPPPCPPPPLARRLTELFTVTIGALAKPVEMFFDARAEFSGTALVHFQDRAVRPLSPALFGGREMVDVERADPPGSFPFALQSAGKAWEQLNEKLVDGSPSLSPSPPLSPSKVAPLTRPCTRAPPPSSSPPQETKLYLFLVFQSPPTPALSISAPPPPPPPITSLGQLAPFPPAQQKPRKPAKALAQRLGPAVVPLASRLGKVVGGGEGVQIQVQGQPKKKKAGGPAAAAASLKKKAPGGAGRKKRSSAAKAVRMEVD